MRRSSGVANDHRKLTDKPVYTCQRETMQTSQSSSLPEETVSQSFVEVLLLPRIPVFWIPTGLLVGTHTICARS